MMVVPRSGCLKTSTIGTPASTRIPSISRNSRTPVLLLQYVATAMMSPMAANSDGWSWRGPNWYHRTEPYWLFPMRNTPMSPLTTSP
jgi:hypothetical protein